MVVVHQCVRSKYWQPAMSSTNFHSFTGGDYTSSFFHKEKITYWKNTCVKPKFLAALSILGNQVTLDDETFSTLEE